MDELLFVWLAYIEYAYEGRSDILDICLDHTIAIQSCDQWHPKQEIRWSKKENGDFEGMVFSRGKANHGITYKVELWEVSTANTITK